MHKKPRGPWWAEDYDAVQRSVVLKLLRDDREMLLFDELHAALRSTKPDVLRHAVKLLKAGKAIHFEEDVRGVAWVTDGTRYLHSLGMVGV